MIFVGVYMQNIWQTDFQSSPYDFTYTHKHSHADIRADTHTQIHTHPCNTWGYSFKVLFESMLHGQPCFLWVRTKTRFELFKIHQTHKFVIWQTHTHTCTHSTVYIHIEISYSFGTIHTRSHTQTNKRTYQHQDIYYSRVTSVLTETFKLIAVASIYIMVLLVWMVLWKVPLKKQISVSSINILLKQNKCHSCAALSLLFYFFCCFKMKKKFILLLLFAFGVPNGYELLNPLLKKVIDFTMCQLFWQSLLIAFELLTSRLIVDFQFDLQSFSYS